MSSRHLVRTIIVVAIALTTMAATSLKHKKTAPPKKKASHTVGDVLKKIETKSTSTNIQKSKSALPAFNAQVTQEKSKINLKGIKPPPSNKLYFDENTDEAQLEHETDKLIDQAYKLTVQYSQSPRRGELWLRLAEQYVEKARLIEYRVLTKHDTDMQAFQEGKLKRKPTINLSESVVYNNKAIQLYEWFLRDFPRDPKTDQVLFFLGYNYFEKGEPKKGQLFYVRLTKEFPKSLYVSESNFALGEYYFDSEHWKESLDYYGRVAAVKSSRLYSFALYKMAWCYYKLNNSKKGLSYIEQVIYEGRKSKGEKDKSMGGVSRIRLATEAIKDLIVFFAESGDYTKAREYFTSVIGQKSANANMAKLAYFYVDTGNRPAARSVFKDLIDQDPNSIKAYDYQYAIVKMYGASGDPQIFNKELFSWIELYGPRSNWQKTNAKEQDAVKKANELMETLLRNHVLQQHQVAQNTRTKSSQAMAKNGYQLYFDTFSSAPKIDEMHFFYGELLFDMDDYERAAGHYLWVAENAPKSQYYNKALLNSLLAFEKRLPSDSQIKKIVGNATTPVALTPEIKDFETSAHIFLEKAPNSENVVAVKYRLGAIYYLFNQFEQAIPLLTEVVKKYPKTQYAKFAANHLLDIYNLKQDYVGLQQVANDILAIPALANSDVGTQIRDIKLRTDFKMAKDLEDKKDYAQSAKVYEDFAARNKSSNLALSAQFNSAVNYERAGNVLKAIDMYALVAANHAKGGDDMANKSKKFLPVLFEKTGQYVRAAQYYDSYAKSNPKDQLADEYHYNAAIIYDGMNAYEPAVKNFEEYFNKHKGRDKAEALFLIAKIYERRGQKDKAIAYYNKYLTSGTDNSAGVVEATFTIASLHESLGRKKVTEEWLQKTVATQKRLAARGHSVGSSYAAQAKYKLVYKTYQELTAVHIPSNPAHQAAAVQQKLGLLNRLKNELKTVVAYDDGPEIVAALTLQGQALQHMNYALMTTPVPKGLKPEELKQYQDGIKKLADPFREQAIEAYKTAIDKSFQIEGYGEALNEALKNQSLINGKHEAVFDTKVLLSKQMDWLGVDKKRLTEATLLKAAAEKLSEDPSHLQTLNQLAIFYYDEKKYGLAKTLVRRALKDHGDESGLHNNLGVIYLAENDQRLALESFKKSVQLKSGRSVGATNLSSIYLQYHDYQRSLATLEESYKAMRSDLRRGDVEAVAVANNYGVALMGTGDNAGSKKVFEEISTSDTRNPAPFLNYAILLVEVLKEKKDAMRVISKLKLITEDREYIRRAQELEKKLE